jgi:hypothetical protein
MKPNPDFIPRTRYLLGWAAGTESAHGERFEIEEWHAEDRRRYTKVFPTAAAAEQNARRMGVNEGSRLFVRAYAYETADPKPAKGLPLLSTVEKTFYYL